jgi:hypothetical protein
MREERAEQIREIILTDPILVSFIEKAVYPGIKAITDNGKYQILYENAKAKTFAIIDPWTEEITIGKEGENEIAITMHYTKLIKILRKLFGAPAIHEIAKYHASHPELDNLFNQLFNPST